MSNNYLSLLKSVSSPYTIVGNTVTYTIVASNRGPIPLGNVNSDPVVISDMLNSNLQFISGSVSINGVSVPSAGILEGINLGVLDIGQKDTIVFSALVVNNINGVINNTAIGNYGYQIPGYPPQTGTSLSNPITIDVDSANINIDKSANTNFAVLGETITYTVILTNTGSVDAVNVLFQDELPEGTSLINGSFIVNGNVINSVDLNDGVNIGDIKVGQWAVIIYQVIIYSPNCTLKIKNSASVNFRYILPDKSSGFIQSTPSPTSVNTIDVGISNFKQISIEEYLSIPPQKPTMEDINVVNGSINIIKCHTIKTAKTRSTEGQYLSGHKVIVHATLSLTIEYTACEEIQEVHCSQYNIPFSTFVVLPDNYTIGDKLEIEGEVEDTFYKMIDCRTFFTNSSVLVNAKVLFC